MAGQSALNICHVNQCRFKRTHVTSGHCCGICGEYGHGQLECYDEYMQKKLRNMYGGDILSEDKQCTVPECKYTWSHITAAHHCNLCKKRGHGSIQCPTNTIKLTCPVCREENIIKEEHIGVTGNSDNCVVCLTNTANVFFPSCKHINTCYDCVKQLNINESVSSRHVISLQDRIIQQSDINDVDFPMLSNELQNENGKIYILMYAGMGCTWYLRRDNVDKEFEGFFLHSDNQGQYGSDDRPFVNIFTRGYRQMTISQ